MAAKARRTYLASEKGCHVSNDGNGDENVISDGNAPTL